MKFEVYGRFSAVRRASIITQKHIIISITDPKTPPVQFMENDALVDIMRLSFHDIDKPIDGYQLFSDSQAIEISNFVKKHLQDIELIVCQCEAGISRSPAIAAALSKAITDCDTFYFRCYSPNRFVYGKLLIQLVEDGIYKCYPDISDVQGA